MPLKKSDYHPEWKTIALEVKNRAKWICEGCDRPCKKPGESWDDLKYRLARKSKKLYDECVDKKVRFVLTVSHQDHNVKNNVAANLKALCSVCHLRYDAKHHAKNAAKTRKLKSRFVSKVKAKIKK